MAKYKLTTVLYHEDNCEAEEAFIQHQYMRDVVNSDLQNWERVEVELEVSCGGKTQTFKDSGEKPATEVIDIRNHPWQKMPDRMPPADTKLLFYDNHIDEMFFGLYDANYNEVIEEFHHTSYDSDELYRLSWRTIEAPHYEK